jgi:hypothetical protein
VDARPDVPQDIVDLGPISPELALVDPVLAEQARKLLPDPVEPPKRRLRPVEPDVPVAVPAQPAAVEAELAPVAPGRRWLRAVALAAVVFAAGAASGNFYGSRGSPPGVSFEARTDAQPAGTGAQPAATGAQPARAGPATAQSSHTRAARRRSAKVSQRRSALATKTSWASNVIGVEARVGTPGVTLVWKRPADSEHVTVLRSPSSGGRGVVVFRGRAAAYRDPKPRPCSSYRYTIVNYDRHGHRSTGVPTSVVTGGCT